MCGYGAWLMMKGVGRVESGYSNTALLWVLGAIGSSSSWAEYGHLVRLQVPEEVLPLRV